MPLASERFGDPGRLRAAACALFSGSVCLGRPDGVLVPLVDVPEGLSAWLSFRLGSSSDFFCSSFWRSSSDSSVL